MKPIASLSLDLDNKWSYLKTHGDPGWEKFPSYLDLVVPRVLDFLRARDLTITFFIVGQDAALARNRPALQAIAAAGHEIGNHSFSHEPWLHLYSEDEISTELARAEEHIERATGVKPIGFRGPGFSLSTATLRELVRRGYLYDATSFPNLLNPLARAYFFLNSNLSRKERKRRGALFGTLSDSLSPVKPYRWRLMGGALTEIPVTTMPLFRLPIHFSYILYLSKYSRSLARSYFRAALALCRMTRTTPSLLLHLLDFMGREDDGDLRFFPGMDMPRDTKLETLAEIVDLLAQRYRIVPMKEHVRHATAEDRSLPLREPRFNH